MTEDEIQCRLDSLCKPPGSLGRLEDLAATLCRIQQTLRPATKPRRIVVFAGDHGVAVEGVTAWPSEITALMIRNIASGGAASSVLARSFDAEIVLVDVGSVAALLPPQPGYVAEKIRPGTRNLHREPAMTAEEFGLAHSVGASQANQAADAGMRVVVAGEMGIGNTTPASCLTALLTGVSTDEVVGPGAGSMGGTLDRKRVVVCGAVKKAQHNLATDPVLSIASVCGFEIAAMSGFYKQAAVRGMTVVLDGFIATSAALIAERLEQGTVRAMIASHQSAEPGHAIALRHLGLRPFLDTWQMRLGEGTGALLLLPLLDAAAAIIADMATLRDIGVNSDGS